ncbi:MAG TPA: metalloregulator ArsR/SmtB family transcription factor [Candidatus Bilamarchaeum sp.]|nr:metalloregulator ArsR/SmtB family transcription factor [Candidatus Bilamarchaeum sp.]
MAKTSLFKALSDPTRLRIVEILLRGERCACELPEMLGKAQPTVSLQLKKLVGAGVLTFRKDGVKSIYSVSDPRAARLIEVVG